MTLKLKHAPLRHVLLSALFILGCWGFLSSLFLVAQSWQDYQRSHNLADWTSDASQIMVLAQHLAFERGRSAVLLSNDKLPSPENRAFIDERRALAGAAFKALHTQLATKPNVGESDFAASWQVLEAMRKDIDRDLALPLAQRDPTLPARWVTQTTAMLERGSKIAQTLAQHYRQGEEMDRLTTFGFYALTLRLTAGSVATIITQHVASKDPLTQGEITALHEMQGQQEMLWAEIRRTAAYLDIPQLKEMTARVYHQHRTTFWPLQNRVLKAWMAGQAAEVSPMELMKASSPVLDGISDLITFALHESKRVTSEKMRAAEMTLIARAVLTGIFFTVMLLAIRYVMTRVVRPLECVDDKLRNIHLSGESESQLHTNEIERLKETAQILQTLFAEKTRLESELRELAFYDDLTALPNRRLMLDRLARSLLRAQRDRTQVALLFIDLDKFKSVNDEHGHEAGDWLLHAVAQRILDCIRASDTAARIGGDEFVVILPDLSQADDALGVAEKICDAINEPFATPEGLWLEISLSMGVAIYPRDADNESDLMRIADTAMFRVKGEGESEATALQKNAPEAE